MPDPQSLIIGQIRVEALKDNEDTFVLLFIHFSKQEDRSSCISLVITIFHKICFLLGLFLIYARGKMRSQDGTAGEPKTNSQPLCS